MVEGDTQKALAEHLAETVKRSSDGYPAYSLLTGFIGTAWISKALSDNGMSDLAYRLLLHDDYPSWLYPVKNGLQPFGSVSTLTPSRRDSAATIA